MATVKLPDKQDAPGMDKAVVIYGGKVYNADIETLRSALGITTPDYAENDPIGAGYIKNRPFFEELRPAVKGLSCRETADSATIIPTIEGVDEADVAAEFTFRKISDYVGTADDYETLELVGIVPNESGESEEQRISISEFASSNGLSLTVTPFGDAIMLSVLDIYCVFCAPGAGTYTGTMAPNGESTVNVSITVPEVGSYTNVYALFGDLNDGVDMWFELPERTAVKKIDAKFLPDGIGGKADNLNIVEAKGIDSINLSDYEIGDVILLVGDA